MIIKIPVRFEGSNGDKILYTLFDSGSTFSFIHPDYAELIADPQKLKHSLEVATASEGHYLKISEKILTDSILMKSGCQMNFRLFRD